MSAVEVLAAHRAVDNVQLAEQRCTCGERAPIGRPSFIAWQTGGWADEMPRGASRPALILGMAQRATDWLRARADRIARGEADHG